MLMIIPQIIINIYAFNFNPKPQNSNRQPLPKNYLKKYYLIY